MLRRSQFKDHNIPRPLSEFIDNDDVRVAISLRKANYVKNKEALKRELEEVAQNTAKLQKSVKVP
jgi:hypothetical protein